MHDHLHALEQRHNLLIFITTLKKSLRESKSKLLRNLYHEFWKIESKSSWLVKSKVGLEFIDSFWGQFYCLLDLHVFTYFIHCRRELLKGGFVWNIQTAIIGNFQLGASRKTSIIIHNLLESLNDSNNHLSNVYSPKYVEQHYFVFLMPFIHFKV